MKLQDCSVKDNGQFKTCLFTDSVHMVTICHEMYNFETKLLDQGNTKYFRDSAFKMEPCLYMNSHLILDELQFKEVCELKNLISQLVFNQSLESPNSAQDFYSASFDDASENEIDINQQQHHHHIQDLQLGQLFQKNSSSQMNPVQFPAQYCCKISLPN